MGHGDADVGPRDRSVAFIIKPLLWFLVLWICGLSHSLPVIGGDVGFIFISIPSPEAVNGPAMGPGKILRAGRKGNCLAMILTGKPGFRI